MTAVDLQRAEAAIGEGFAEADIVAMIARPGFSDALRRMVNRSLAFYDADAVLHRNIKDIGRLVLGMLALYLDATGGLTHRRLRDLSGGVGVLSAGRASAILWQLQMIGYVTPATTGPRGAQRLYTPTPAMTEAFRERIRIEFEAMAMIEPGLEGLLARFDEPNIFRILITMMGEDTMRAAMGSRLEPGLEDFRELGHRTAGALIRMALLQDADDGGPAFPACRPVGLSAAALARRFEVSRTHVLSILRMMETSGYLSRGGGEGVGVIEPSLVEDFRRFYAIAYLGTIRTAHAVLERISAAQ